MQQMSPDEYRHFLLDRPRTAKIATVRKDGRPHIAPIWFDLEGDIFVFTTWHKSVKGLNLLRDPRVSLCIDDELPPFAYALIEGTATFHDDVELLQQWATRIAGRYMGLDQAEAYGKRNSVPGELVVKVTPHKVSAYTGISDW